MASEGAGQVHMRVGVTIFGQYESRASYRLNRRGARNAQQQTLRVGHFPNITHVQGLVGHALTRQGKGWFEAQNVSSEPHPHRSRSAQACVCRAPGF